MSNVHYFARVHRWSFPWRNVRQMPHFSRHTPPRAHLDNISDIESHYGSADANVSNGKWVGPLCYDVAAIDEYSQAFNDHNAMLSYFARSDTRGNEAALSPGSFAKKLTPGEMRIRLRKFIFEKAITLIFKTSKIFVCLHDIFTGDETEPGAREIGAQKSFR